MKWPLITSISIHMAVLGLVFVNFGSKQIHPKVTSIEIVSFGGQNKKARRKRKAAVVKKPNKVLSENKSQISQTSAFKKPGSDKENVKEVKASQVVANAMEIATYGQELKLFIEKNRYYPRRALSLGHTGLVKVQLTINSSGEFEKVEIIEPAKFDSLNQAVTDLFAEIRSFKPLPQSYRGTGVFIVPIQYEIKGGF